MAMTMTKAIIIAMTITKAIIIKIIITIMMRMRKQIGNPIKV